MGGPGSQTAEHARATARGSTTSKPAAE
jgi:hypothetical protein